MRPEFVQGSSKDTLETCEDSNDTTSSLNPFNRNPKGKNQHMHCPPKKDQTIIDILIEYQRRNITNRKTISELLFAEHGIHMSVATVARRRKEAGLKASGAITNSLPATVKQQLVLDQMAADPLSRRGPRTVREAIVNATGLPLTQIYVTEEMQLQDPDGFLLRQPGSRKIKCFQLVVLGPHQEWSGDGHDKLTAIGFPVWGVRDVWSGVWLGLWVLPNNRLKAAIAYLYLSLVEKMGGMSVQMTTDCGSETGHVFALANILREIFSPELVDGEIPAHRFLRSVTNITIERGWLQLRLQWGDNVKVYWEAGHGIYNEADVQQRALVDWLWPS
ncbi:hypothetical protein M422DRAFT_247775 [Sphaerobolus stellatus SS14]|nr:hypothetical protein M422DRAFT_247775 [Sphaerobolus stellatus SS14]